jgi:MaoC like domain
MSSDAVRPKQPRDFDPISFTVVPPRRFDDLRVGDVFRAPSRTLTDAHAAAFQTVSADNHPIHYDVEYARRHGHIAPVVHGLQVFAFTAPGATLFPQYIGDVFRGVYQCVMQIPQGGARRRYALSCAGNYRAYTAGRHRQSDNPGDGAQPTR